MITFLLAFFFSFVGANSDACLLPQEVVLSATSPTFFLNTTKIDADYCDWNFTFPLEYAAEIRIDGWNMDDYYVKLSSSWSSNQEQYIAMPQPGPDAKVNDTLHIMWPAPYFKLEIFLSYSGIERIAIIVNINITLKLIYGDVVSNLTTVVNQQPQYIQLAEWKAGTAITVQSQSSKRLTVAVAGSVDPSYDYANIFVYRGSWNNRHLIGTISSVMYGYDLNFNKFYTSLTDTLTFYRAMDSDSIATLIVNDHENMKGVKYFITDSDQNNQIDNYQVSAFLDAMSGLAILTILYGVDGSNEIFLQKIVNGTCDAPDCPPYPNYTSPIKLLAGGLIRDYDTQGTLLGIYRDPKLLDDNYPQFVPGIARTFVLEKGAATIYYTIAASNTTNSLAIDGRNGFVMSNNYPFKAADQNSQNFALTSVDGNLFTFEYTIQETDSNADAYLNFTVQETASIELNTFTVDLCNNTTPITFNITALTMMISIVGGVEPSTGTYISYRVYDTGIPPPTQSTVETTTMSTTTTTTTTSTSKSSTAVTVTTGGTATVSGTTSSTPIMAAWQIALICLGILLFLALILIILCLRYRIRRGKYRKFWSTMSGVLPIAVKVDEWELGDKQLEIFEDKELGRGVFGIVYEGELYGDRPVDRIIRSVQKMTQEEKEQKKVAVKRLPLNADNQARLDFTEEISFMKKLGYHPHILGMIGCITVGTSTPSIVLNYCQNGDLLSWVRKNKYSTDMKPEQLLLIAWQISDGLCYLKSQNLIHRDLAARNVLLTEDLVAKISDFGLCRKPEISEDSSTYLPNFYVSRGGRLPVKWLAPESLRDFHFSFKTDLWSYGVILWEMYTFGDVPFGDVNPLNLLELLNNGERLPQGAISDPIYKLMYGCWDAVPGKRTPIEKLKDTLHEMLTTSTHNYEELSTAINIQRRPS